MKPSVPHNKKPRPLSGITKPSSRVTSQTPKRLRLQTTPRSSESVPRGQKLSYSSQLSPYFRLIPFRLKPETFSISISKAEIKSNSKSSPCQILHSWSCKSSQSKFQLIRPCIILDPPIDSTCQLFGLCDGENKESVSMITSKFIDLIKSNKAGISSPNKLLMATYLKTVQELKQLPGVLVNHEFSVALIRNGEIFPAIVGFSGMVIGRKTGKTWTASVVKRNSVKCIDSSLKVLIFCNQEVLQVLTPKEIVETAGKYWEMQNPNIASWELIEKVRSVECPICVVIFIYNSDLMNL